MKNKFDINPFAHLSDAELRKLLKHWDEISGFEREKDKLNELKQ